MAHTDRPATLRDVATAAGVHPATASRALNPGTRLLVSEETARRVSEAADRLGYRPNPVARSLRTRRSHTIGVLIPDLNNPLFPPIVRGIEDRLAEHGYVALIGNTDADLAKERLVFDQMRARHVDGFVLATATAGSPILAEAAQAGCPAGADEPHRAGLPVLRRLRRQRAGRAGGGRAPGRARAHQDRAHRRPAGRLHRRRPAARLPGRHGRAPAPGARRPGRLRHRLLPGGGGALRPGAARGGRRASPRSSPPTTCSRSAATARSTSSACAARKTSP